MRCGHVENRQLTSTLQNQRKGDDTIPPNLDTSHGLEEDEACRRALPRKKGATEANWLPHRRDE